MIYGDLKYENIIIDENDDILIIDIDDDDSYIRD
jgi:hypothetical protein